MITPPVRSTMNGKPVITVPVKTVLNLHSGFEHKLLCDGPALALGDGCAYSCAFCYVPSVYQKLGRVREALDGAGLKHEDAVILRENAIEVLRGQLWHPNGKRRFPDANDRRVVYASPADDVGANMDLARATVEACKLILTATNWQIRLLSKSTFLPKIAGDLMSWAENNEDRFKGAVDVPEPFELGAEVSSDPIVTQEGVRSRMIFGVSTGTFDDGLAAAIEHGTPRVSKRIESLHVLQDSGFRTFAMICPSLPKDGSPAYEEFANEAAALVRYARCEHVWAEVINLRGESFTRTIDALRVNGFGRMADQLHHVTHTAGAWEEYNRQTFLAHAKACAPWVGKLRFLTYVTDASRPWWQKHIARGAVLL